MPDLVVVHLSNLNKHDSVLKQIALFLIIFLLVSMMVLFFMKAIVLVLLQWGGKFAIPLAIFLSTIYVWCFKLARSIEDFALTNRALGWIWVLGFTELIVLGGLYHLTPQFFPSWVGNFFFQ